MSQSDVIDISRTIIPKSDQLNADQLLGGPLTITVSSVTMSGGEDQPVSVHYAGENGRPYKPCKTMRKLLVYAWGANGANWAGRSMTLFNEPDVKFGGETVGGIRISHLSDIASDIRVSLTTTRGKKAQTSVKKMQRPTGTDHAGLIKAATTMDELKSAFESAIKATRSQETRDELTRLKDERKAALQNQPTTSLATFRAAIDAATSPETAGLVLDEARDVLDALDHQALGRYFEERWP